MLLSELEVRDSKFFENGERERKRSALISNGNSDRDVVDKIESVAMLHRAAPFTPRSKSRHAWV